MDKCIHETPYKKITLDQWNTTIGHEGTCSWGQMVNGLHLHSAFVAPWWHPNVFCKSLSFSHSSTNSGCCPCKALPLGANYCFNNSFLSVANPNLNPNPTDWDGVGFKPPTFLVFVQQVLSPEPQSGKHGKDTKTLMSIFMIKMHAKLPQYKSKPFQWLVWVKKWKKREPTNVVQTGGVVNQSLLE